MRWDNHWWGVEITGEMSKLAERCTGHEIAIDINEGAVLAAMGV